MQLCGEPDKPEVKKHIEDLDSAWENVTSLYAKREQNLLDAMEKAMNFHDILGVSYICYYFLLRSLWIKFSL